MSVNENGNLRPDGVSLSLPLRPWFGLGGTYYWNPGSPTAPWVTLTGALGMGGGGLHEVFLRRGMTSGDTLGYGTTADVSAVGPSVIVNSSIPDENGIPQPGRARVSSVETGVGFPGFAATYTTTPQRIADFLSKYIIGPAMGPQDELSPFERSLQSGVATVGQPSAAPVRFTGLSSQDPLGAGMASWGSSVGSTSPWWPASPKEQLPPQGPGGLLGMIQGYFGNNSN